MPSRASCRERTRPQYRVGEDEDDLRLLASELGLAAADEVLAVAEKTFGDRLDPAARFFVEEVFAT